jgi:hypothetical protein
LDTPEPNIEFLSEFNGLEQAIADGNKVSQSDQRLGEVLFADSPIQTKTTQDKTFTKSSTEYSHSFVKKKQIVENNPSNSKTFSILPWLSALFICLLPLFIWGVFSEFKDTLSPQVTSVPTKDISTEAQVSSQPKPKITSTKSYSARRFLDDNFPLNSCGDKDPGGANSWYPVYVMNTAKNLNRLKFNYCRDAIIKYREEETIKSIQVASFLDQSKAQEFANLM